MPAGDTHEGRDAWLPLMRGWFIPVCALLVVMYATLSPFEFQWPEERGVFQGWREFRLGVLKPGILWDVMGNVLLFVPLGFGLSAAWPRRGGDLPPHYVTISLLAMVVSTGVEMGQIGLPGRTPTIMDVLANACGGALGHAVYRTRQRTRRLALSGGVFRISAPRCLWIWIIACVAYAGAAVLGIRWLSSGSLLTNWDPEFPLVLCNEYRGERVWEGTIEGLHIVPGAVPPDGLDEFIAGSRGETATGRPRVDRSDLVSSDTFVQEELDGIPWRWSQDIGTAVGTAIRDTSAFVLHVEFVPNRADQFGPARIVSISWDPYLRNLTVGQDRRDLILRLRTRFAGENGMRPEIVVPEVLAAGRPTRLVMVYDRRALRVYVNESPEPRVFWMTPEALFSRVFLPNHGPPMTGRNTARVFQWILFYGTLAAPAMALLQGVLRCAASRRA